MLPGPGDYTLRWAGPDGTQHVVHVQVAAPPPSPGIAASGVVAAELAAPPKPGVRTSEFWLTLATTATPVVALGGGQKWVAVAAAGASAVVGVAYTVSRAKVKLDPVRQRVAAGGHLQASDVSTAVEAAAETLSAVGRTGNALRPGRR